MEEIQEYQPTTQELINQVQSNILSLIAELNAMGYLTSKEADEEDMSQYGDWKAHRKHLREQIRILESEELRLKDVLIQEQEQFNTGDI